MVLWGQMLPGFVLLLTAWEPFALSATRYIIAAPAMLLVTRIMRGPLVLPPRSDWPKLSLLGFFGMGGLITFYTYGIAHSNPVTAIVVQSTSPLTYCAIAVLVYREPLPKGLGPALCLVIPGALLLAGPALMGDPLSFRGGEPLLICGSACWAWYSLQCHRWLPDYGELRITTWTMVAAMPFLIALFLLLWAMGLTAPPREVPPLGLNLLLLWLIFTSTCLGVMLWHGGVKRLGVATAGLYFNVSPLVAMAISAALGFVPTVWQLLGGALVLAGVLQLQMRRWLGARRRTIPPV